MRASLFAALLVSTLGPSLAFAALPPKYAAQRKVKALDATRQARTEAPTKVTLEILRATSTSAGDCPVIESVRVKAKVVAVDRAGDAAVKVGATVRVRYKRKYNNCPGPRSYTNPKPEEGKTIPALLTCKGTKCKPAVGYGAFWDDGRFEREYNVAKAKAGPKRKRRTMP